ncbi:MAG: CDP-alcohol phosphatidyltransferase family protein, partial [Nitrososphaerota archaeon]|nr:CDP-alcohol phosphatidyltransferase family protein [Nitrososphaerota archaeon]
LTPNKISVIGFVLSLVSAVAYVAVPMQPVLFLVLAVVFMLASGFCDTMDGIVARKFNQASTFGAFFDSVLDRYADVAIYMGIIVSGLCSPVWGLAALAGSVLVSYTRARAEGVGIKMESVGFAERAERMLILGAFTIGTALYPHFMSATQMSSTNVLGIFTFGTESYLPVLNGGIIVLAVITNITVIQRVYYVFKVLKNNKKNFDI